MKQQNTNILFWKKKREALPISDSTCFCKWSLSQNPLFVKGLYFYYDYFSYVSFCLFYSCLFLNHCLTFSAWFMSKEKNKTNVDWTEKKNCQDQNVTRCKDVMLGWNPSRPAPEQRLDCPPLHCCLFVFLLCQCLACCLQHTHACTIYVICYTLVPLGGWKPPETSENESN